MWTRLFNHETGQYDEGEVVWGGGELLPARRERRDTRYETNVDRRGHGDLVSPAEVRRKGTPGPSWRKAKQVAVGLVAGLLLTGCAAQRAVLRSPTHRDRWPIRVALMASTLCEGADNGVSLYMFGKSEGIQEQARRLNLPEPPSRYYEANPLLRPFQHDPPTFTTMKLGQGLATSALIIGLHDFDNRLLAHGLAWGNAVFKCVVTYKNYRQLEAGRP